MTLSNEYARALFALAQEDERTDAVLDELKAVARVLAENPPYISLLSTPSLKKEQKLALIDEAFASLSEYTLNTLKLLCERRLISIIPEVTKAYEVIFDKVNGITRVIAETAVPMSDSQMAALKLKLERELGGNVIIVNEVEKAMLGGVKLRYSGLQIDGSVKTRLDKLASGIKSVIL